MEVESRFLMKIKESKNLKIDALEKKLPGFFKHSYEEILETEI